VVSAFGKPGGTTQGGTGSWFPHRGAGVVADRSPFRSERRSGGPGVGPAHPTLGREGARDLGYGVGGAGAVGVGDPNRASRGRRTLTRPDGQGGTICPPGAYGPRVQRPRGGNWRERNTPQNPGKNKPGPGPPGKPKGGFGTRGHQHSVLRTGGRGQGGGCRFGLPPGGSHSRSFQAAGRSRGGTPGASSGARRGGTSFGPRGKAGGGGRDLGECREWWRRDNRGWWVVA